ncbi:MAG: methyl-accepting chemotaxis protein [Aulosira sp. ZfuVER01]|nr:methyl-accepting chemotaxis protein [Aulosira sp. ZfuVER01]MDZ7997024.1 methyl-accepting chemotaxis protein [Aulosira sp. DedVER01a]MDZ8053053.1 methyl-accepting chemotaxis protein [Aulosira sp. ZfuCHP01]
MFKNVTLKTRMLSSFLFIGLIVLTVALLGWFTTSQSNRYIENFSKNHIPTVNGIWKINEGQTQIQSAERLLFDPEIAITERQNALTQIQLAWKQIQEGTKEYEATPFTEQEKKEYEAFRQNLALWKQAYEKFLQLEQQYDQIGIRNPWKKSLELIRQKQENSSEFTTIQAALNLRQQMDSQGANNEEPLFLTTNEQAKNLLELTQSYILKTQEGAEKNVAHSIFWVSLGIVIGPITAIVLGFAIARQISGQIIGVVGVAEQISQGNLTNQISADSSSKDEMVKLLSAFSTMTQNLNTLISRVQKSGIQVTTSATQIAASGKQLEATITEHIASTNQVTVASKEIAATSKELVNTMEQIATMSQLTTTAATVSQKDLQRMETTMKQLAEATNSIASRLGVISEKANNINNIVVTITKVADQTNLLSLNAAIEAEKAGESGLGFAVVAREIRRLADQTAVASLDIEQMVKQMQSSVSTGVMEMDKFATEVGRSMADVASISTQIGQIIQQVQDLNPRFELVNQGMEIQSVGAQQISETMMQLSSTSMQTADSLREINGAIAQLNQISQGLRQEISRFKVKTEDFSSLTPIDVPT